LPPNVGFSGPFGRLPFQPDSIRLLFEL